MPHISSGVADHFQSPRNAALLENPTVVGRADLNGNAPRVLIQLQVEAGRVERSAFQAFGCGHLIASCSALTELVNGRSVVECQLLDSADVTEVLGGLPPYKAFCADLAVAALRDALGQLEGGRP